MKIIMAALAALSLSTPSWAAIGSGSRTNSATILGSSFTIYTYKPSATRCPSPTITFVFHGSSRNASGYRDSAKPFADAQCTTIVAPLFTESKYPSDSYQRGNIVDSNDNVRPESQWTTRFVEAMMAWARTQEGDPSRKVWLYGFSAGGQFLSRVAAYERLPGIQRYVIGSPSTHVRGSLGEDAPYGFRNLGNAPWLAEYLSLPVTIFVGEEDNDPNDPELARGSEAMEQGAHRYARAIFVFNEAKQYAQANSLPFNWRLVTVPNVGHSHGDMIRSSAAPAAFEPGPAPAPEPEPCECPCECPQ